MDVKKLIEGAEWCDSHGMDCHWSDSDSCPESTEFEGECKDSCIQCLAFCDAEEILEHVLAIKAHYEALLAAERSKVVQEVREYVNAWAGYLPGVGTQVSASAMMKKLDSMEPDKVVKTETDKWAGISEEDRKRDLDSSCGP